VQPRTTLNFSDPARSQRRDDDTPNLKLPDIIPDNMTTRPMPADSRPEHIDAILAGLDRYNPETVSTFQDYVQYQCENRTYDALANLALLKL
jgi:hypothetical protein